MNRAWLPAGGLRQFQHPGRFGPVAERGGEVERGPQRQRLLGDEVVADAARVEHPVGDEQTNPSAIEIVEPPLAKETCEAVLTSGVWRCSVALIRIGEGAGQHEGGQRVLDEARFAAAALPATSIGMFRDGAITRDQGRLDQARGADFFERGGLEIPQLHAHGGGGEPAEIQGGADARSGEAA